MVCQICTVETEKYKCPVCRLPYCSVDCWKKHKEGEPCHSYQESKTKSDADSPIGSDKGSYQYPTDNTIPKESLERLGYSDELKAALANPHLRAMMVAINSSADPATAIRTAMMEPIFTEFADIALKNVDL